MKKQALKELKEIRESGKSRVKQEKQKLQNYKLISGEHGGMLQDYDDMTGFIEEDNNDEYYRNENFREVGEEEDMLRESDRNKENFKNMIAGMKRNNKEQKISSKRVKDADNLFNNLMNELNEDNGEINLSTKNLTASGQKKVQEQAEEEKINYNHLIQKLKNSNKDEIKYGRINPKFAANEISGKRNYERDDNLMRDVLKNT